MSVSKKSLITVDNKKKIKYNYILDFYAYKLIKLENKKQLIF